MTNRVPTREQMALIERTVDRVPGLAEALDALCSGERVQLEAEVARLRAELDRSKADGT